MANWLWDYMTGNDPATLAAKYRTGANAGLSDPGGRNMAEGLGIPYTPPQASYRGPSDPGMFSQMDARGNPPAPAPESPPPTLAQPVPPPSDPRANPSAPPAFDPAPQAPAPSPVDQARATSAAGIPAPSPMRQDSFADHNLNDTIAQRESGAGWNSGNVNKYSFMPSSWAEFIKSPSNTGSYTAADLKNPQAQEAAMGWHSQRTRDAVMKATGQPATNEQIAQGHLLGPAMLTAALQDPGGDAFSTYARLTSEGQAVSAFTNNGGILKKGMTNGEVLGSVSKFYQSGDTGSSSGSGPGPSTAPPDGPQGPARTPQQEAIDRAQASAMAFDPSQIGAGMAPINTLQNRLFAGASAMGSGANIGESFGNYGKAMIDLQNTDNSNVMAKAKAISDATNVQTGRLTGIATALTGQQKADTGDKRLVVQQDIATQRMSTQLAIAHERTDMMDKRLAQNDPAAVAAVKSSAKSLDELNGNVETADKTLRDVADLRDLISKSPGTIGPDALSRFQRTVANTLGLDIGVSPDAASFGQKLVTALNTDTIRANSKGLVNRLTQGEFNMISKSGLNMGTNPGAAMAIMDTMEAAARRQIAQKSLWDSQAPEAQRAIVRNPNGGFRNWLASHQLEEAASRGVTGDPSGAQTPPGVTQGSDGKVHYALPNGQKATWQR